ncbi:hypothetical protein IW150_006032 [Coemansia sp. RSA 2607]|nr:hypothetical protein IW150_006032 [Coemansia sp. RSA 2607]
MKTTYFAVIAVALVANLSGAMASPAADVAVTATADATPTPLYRKLFRRQDAASSATDATDGGDGSYQSGSRSHRSRTRTGSRGGRCKHHRGKKSHSGDYSDGQPAAATDSASA